MSIEDTLEAITKQLENHEKRISKLEARPQTENESTNTNKKISIKEYIIAKKPQKDTEKTLAIGHYLEKFEGCSHFIVKDIEAGFRSAKEPVPTNINDMVNKNISEGFIMDAKEKKGGKRAWVLTNSGEKCVEDGFEVKK